MLDGCFSRVCCVIISIDRPGKAQDDILVKVSDLELADITVEKK